MKLMKLVLAANWYGKSPWWSSLSFIFFWGGGLTQIILGGSRRRNRIQMPSNAGEAFTGLLGGQQAHVEIIESHQCRTSPSFGAGFSKTGSEPCKCTVDKCPERILRPAGANWQTGFTTAKGSSRLNQSKQPFPTKGIFLPNSAGWEVPFHVFSIQQPHYQVPESSQTIRHQPSTQSWISAKIILSFWQSKLEVSPAGCLIHPLGSTFPLPKHSK